MKSKMKKLKERVDALEVTLREEWAILYFEDGTTREIRGPRGFLFRLFRATRVGPDVTPGQAEHLKLIRQCVGAREAGGAHMVDLIKCMMAAEETIRNMDPLLEELSRSQ
jgi:hypothetical protein